VSWFRSRRGVAALLGILLLILFAIRPSVGPLRTRIARSISISLGRQVEISSASLRLLPQPGFDLENFVVHDDPAFSLEPVLRSDEVSASLRITSLLRGHLEIARLTLTEPSLNLVRNEGGHWNLEYLLERAARISVAPTGKPASETRPGFPYIEANGGRINFKFGMEKKQFALTEADFSLFQDSENSWGVRLKAKPVRTDSNFSDTGLLKITGSWQRAQSLHETPLRFGMQWEQAQLGQASKLIYGNDKGWRGAAALSAEISGTADNLAILTEGSVEDFRRYDIPGGSPMRLRAQCGAHYRSATQTLSNIICESPVGDGALTLHGTIAVSKSPTYHLAIFAQDVPLQSLIALSRHSKKDIPSDLIAAGTLDGTMKIQREKTSDKTTSWEGSGETSEFRLASQLAPSQISLPKICFAIPSANHSDIDLKKHRRMIHESARSPVETPSLEAHVDISPFTIALGDPVPVTVAGWFSRSGYSLTIEGNARLQQLLRASRTIGIPTPQPDAEGKVKLGLQLADTWAGFKAPRITGEAELHSVRAKVRGLNTPIEIDAAKIILDPEKVNVQSLTALAGGTTWHGSLVLPRPCGLMGTCPIQMDLHADEIATDQVGKLLGAQDAKRPWYGFLMASQKSPYLLALRATGHLAADRIVVHRLAGTNFSTNFDLDRGRLKLANLHGTVLGGTHSGEWTLDFTVRPPAYSGEGSFQHVALAQLGTAMHDNWISGIASATYHATASGWNAGELFSSATGILQIEAQDGFMPHIVSADFGGSLQFRTFEGGLVLRHKELDFEESRLAANGGFYEVTGTATLGRAIHVKLVRSGSRGFNITGTLSTPVVSTGAIPETRAALKP
jgi:AsmA family